MGLQRGAHPGLRGHVGQGGGHLDIGAQGDAIKKAENGRLIRFAPDGNLAQNVLNSLTKENEQAEHEQA